MNEYIGVVTNVGELLMALGSLMADGKIDAQTTLYVNGMHPAVDIEEMPQGRTCINFEENA